MVFLITGIVLIVIALGISAWYFWGMSRACNPPLPTQVITVGGSTFQAELATTGIEQMCGLSGRTGLDDGKGMLFIFGSPGTQTFWMKDMNFAIDMIWISGNTVAGFAQDAPAPVSGTQIWQLKLYGSPSFLDKVLEVPAGTVAKDGIKVGDQVSGI